MYTIRLTTKDVSFNMPKERHTSLFQAIHLANLYKTKNRSAKFSVINLRTGDVEYETE